jgi:hypothetical protein
MLQSHLYFGGRFHEWHDLSVNEDLCLDQTSNGTEIKQNGIELNTADVEIGEVHQVIRIYIKCNIVFNLSFHQK